MKLKTYLLLVFISAFLFSCGSKKKVANAKERSRPERILAEPSSQEERQSPHQIGETVGVVVPNKSETGTVEDYIRAYAAIAQEEMRLYNIPASITIAQAILESGVGKGELSRRANNHFGIKCHEWRGPVIYHDDDARGECFRKYKHPKYSYRDHSLFLTERKRYAALFELDKDDYKGWAKGLKKAGYATDRKYPDKLIGLIERYELYRLDADVLERPSPSYTHTPEASSATYVVRKGDTLYSIAKRHNTTVDTLRDFNNLRDTNHLAVGQILYVISPSE